MSNVDLGGRTALVTGASRGIGRAIAKALARAGARVLLVARARDELAAAVAEIGPNARAAVADVRDAGQLDAAMTEAQTAFGNIDILVNNAGVGGPIGPLAETDAQDWWETMEINLHGPLRTMQRVLPGMIAARRGTIVNVVTSPGAFAFFSAYSASKSALIRLSECVAAEVASAGVAVFAMGPGTVRTAMSERSLESPEGKLWLPWFKSIFDEGLDLAPEVPAALAVRLASGRYDALSGLIVNPRDDLDEMLARIEEIKRDKLYSMRMRTFESPDQQRLNQIRDKGTRGAG